MKRSFSLATLALCRDMLATISEMVAMNLLKNR
jgi:hypothetical protein